MTTSIHADDSGVVVASVTGDLDLVRAPEVRAQLSQVLSNQDHGLVVDLTDADYLDSAGVNMLFELAERLENRQLRLAVVLREGSMVEEVATLVDLRSGMGVHNTREDALADAGAG